MRGNSQAGGGGGTGERDSYGVRRRGVGGVLDPAAFLEVCGARVGGGVNHIDYVNSEVKPALVTSWEVSEDGTVYTFELRKGVKFHDVNTMTATDCERSFMRLMDPDDPSQPEGAYAIAEIGGGKGKEKRGGGDKTLQITPRGPPR